MEKFGWFLAFLLLVVAVIVCVAAVQNVAGIMETRRLEAESAQARAEADRLAARLDLTQAQANLETAAGERAVLEAAARSVDADRRLVTWYTLRGDLRSVLAFSGILGLTVCAVVIVTVVQRWQDANTNRE